MLNLDILGKKNVWFAISGVVLALSLIGMLVIGFNYSIDFKGGSSSDVKFEKAASVEEIRSVLKEQGLGESKIQPIENIVGTDAGALTSTTKGSMMLLRTTELSTEQEAELFKALDAKFGVVDRQTKTVDASWGALITERAVYAFVAALILLLVFITVRYEFKMSVAAILALFHDIIITAGVYALVGREVNPNMIAALITILGYSLYDTIVVFHRIKENSPGIVRTTYEAMANKSINQVFMRSVNTSLTTLLPIVAIMLFGGETLKDFAFALMVGTIVGAYSSIFFAAPIFVVWKEAEPYYRNLKNKYGKDAIARASTS
ncbi:MAG: protein translocase subunit SecF [Actinobacteria bacterium]|nr:protein translocase subunit SecF [Actinomycetota bacterium]